MSLTTFFFGVGSSRTLSSILISVNFSPFIKRTAIGSFTLIDSCPSYTKILPITPSSTASTSIVALSVSISAIRSPELTLSPSLTSHLAKVPSSMVGLRAGIKILILIIYP